MTVSLIFLFRQIRIFLSFKKWLYFKNIIHSHVILLPISLLISLPDVTNLPKYLYSVTSSHYSPSIIAPVLSLLLAISLQMIVIFFLFSFIPSTLVVQISQHIFQFLFTFSKRYYIYIYQKSDHHCNHLHHHYTMQISTAYIVQRCHRFCQIMHRGVKMKAVGTFKYWQTYLKRRVKGLKF